MSEILESKHVKDIFFEWYRSRSELRNMPPEKAQEIFWDDIHLKNSKTLESAFTKAYEFEQKTCKKAFGLSRIATLTGFATTIGGAFIRDDTTRLAVQGAGISLLSGGFAYATWKLIGTPISLDIDRQYDEAYEEVKERIKK